MDSKGEPQDDGIIRIKRLEPGHVDIVLGSHPGRNITPPRPPRPYGLIALCALLAIFSLCLFMSQLNRHTPDTPQPAPSAPISEPTNEPATVPAGTT